MAKTNWTDKITESIESPHINGLQDAIRKIEEALDIDTVAETAIAMTEVYIGALDRYRLYQCASGKRNWLASPAPVVKKNGDIISSGFTIDYGGGALEFNPRLLVTDTITVDATYTTNTITSRNSVPLTVTQQVTSLPSTVVEGTLKATLKGNTDVTIFQNGNFINGDNWSPLNATESVANNIYTCAGNGGSASPRARQVTSIKTVIAQQYYARAMVRVTNSSCASIEIQLSGTTGGSYIKTIGTPTINIWYPLSDLCTLPSDITGDLLIDIVHRYADAGTASGKVMEIKEVMGIDLTKRFGVGNVPSVADCALRYANWFDGIKSTEYQRFKSIGKNFVRNGNLEEGVSGWALSANAALNIVDGRFQLVTSASAKYAYRDITLNTNTVYYIGYNATSAEVRIYGNSTGKLYVSDASGSFTTGAETSYQVRLYRVSSGTGYFDSIQLEIGSVATTYEKYKETYVYTNNELNSASSTIYDEIDLNSGLCTKRTHKETINFVGFSKVVTNSNGFDVWRNSSYTFAYAPYNWVNTNITSHLLLSKNIGIVKNLEGWDYQIVWSIYSNGIDITVPTGVSLDTFYGTTVIVYKLVTPTSSYMYSKTLLAEPNGNIIIELGIADVDIYSTNIAIANTNYPIKSLDYVNKINIVTGELTSIKISTCTVAAGGLTFTSTELTSTDWVDYGYSYEALSTIPDLDYSYPTNFIAQTTSNTDEIRNINKRLDSIERMLELLL